MKEHQESMSAHDWVRMIEHTVTGKNKQLEDRLTKLEHAVSETRQKLCVVAQAVLKIPISLLFLQEEKNATNCEQIGKELTQLVADLTPEPKKSAMITPEDEPLREYGEDG